MTRVTGSFAGLTPDCDATAWTACEADEPLSSQSQDAGRTEVLPASMAGEASGAQRAETPSVVEPFASFAAKRCTSAAYFGEAFSSA